MFKKLFLLLVTGHILGDFYTQTNQISEKKDKLFSWVSIHGLVYFFTAAIISIPFISHEIFFIISLSSISHSIIDSAKYLYGKKIGYGRKGTGSIFIIDQILHLICLIGLSYFGAKAGFSLKAKPIFSDFFATTNTSLINASTWVLALLILHKPSNIFIQKLIGGYKPQTKNNLFQTDNNIGRIIGTSERIVMLMLISLHQYSAIGLVLTAKSIARYDRIAKDEKFAEYYLLGTLISTGIVIVCGIVFF